MGFTIGASFRFAPISCSSCPSFLNRGACACAFSTWTFCCRSTTRRMALAAAAGCRPNHCHRRCHRCPSRQRPSSWPDPVPSCSESCGTGTQGGPPCVVRVVVFRPKSNQYEERAYLAALFARARTNRRRIRPSQPGKRLDACHTSSVIRLGQRQGETRTLQLVVVVHGQHAG